MLIARVLLQALDCGNFSELANLHRRSCRAQLMAFQQQYGTWAAANLPPHEHQMLEKEMDRWTAVSGGPGLDMGVGLPGDDQLRDAREADVLQLDEDVQDDEQDGETLVAQQMEEEDEGQV